jgi:transposase
MERPAPCGSKIVVIHEPWKEPQAAGKEPTVSSVHPADDVVHVAFDASAATLVAAVLRPGEESATTVRVANDESSIRRFVKRFPEPARLRTCYEAGPTGYELQRLLGSLGVPCVAIAPSLIPTAPGNRVNTDTRDARHLVRQFRAGELTAIRAPKPAEEAVRDLCRARGDAVEDLTRAKSRLEAFLLRHGRVYQAGSTGTSKHRYWLAAQAFDDRALRTTFGRYLATVECREAERAAIEADLAPYLDEAPFAEPVRRLAAYRGVDRLGALVLQAEVGDWRRFASGAAAGAFCGLVPSEYSSGASVHRGSLTHAGNAHLRRQLVEAAWSYRFGPSLGPSLLRRQQGIPPETAARAWATQVDLCRRFRRLDAKKSVRGVVVAAIARRLVGCLHAEMVA